MKPTGQPAGRAYEFALLLMRLVNIGMFWLIIAGLFRLGLGEGS
jgi:hypothetical protein